MIWTTHVLVIANRTIDSPELRDALLARATRGLIDVTLLAPSSHEPGTGCIDKGSGGSARRETVPQRASC